jgi:hypothetical protein
MEPESTQEETVMTCKIWGYHGGDYEEWQHASGASYW